MTPYDLRRQLWETARDQLPRNAALDEELDKLIDALMAEVQTFVLARLGLAR